jgi:hypothetical protein
MHHLLDNTVKLHAVIVYNKEQFVHTGYPLREMRVPSPATTALSGARGKTFSLSSITFRTTVPSVLLDSIGPPCDVHKKIPAPRRTGIFGEKSSKVPDPAKPSEQTGELASDSERIHSANSGVTRKDVAIFPKCA